MKKGEDMRQLEMDIKQEYVRLLDLLARALRANKDLSVSDGERLLAAYGLAFKFFCHALTVFYLSRGTNQELPSLKWHYVDFASVDVLTRATLEAFLVFHYVFYASATAEEKDYRYWAYRAEGMDDKLSIIAFTEKQRERLTAVRKERDKLYDKLKSNTIFQRLNRKRQKEIFKGRSMWRWKPGGKGKVSWRDIAIEAGFSKALARHIYSHLSASAHSSSIGVYQTMPAISKREEEYSYSGTVIIMNIVTANLIREYCGLFPRAQAVLSGDTEGSNIIERWIQRGRKLL